MGRIEVGKIFDFLKPDAVFRNNLIKEMRNNERIGNILYGVI